MDPAILSATAALTGSLFGAASSVVTTWLTQRGQFRAQARFQEIAKREALYAEFIAEASKRPADSFSHGAEGFEVIVGLQAALGRMRLMSSREVVSAAEQLVHLIVKTYSSPNRSFEQLRDSMLLEDSSDPLRTFGEAYHSGYSRSCPGCWCRRRLTRPLARCPCAQC